MKASYEKDEDINETMNQINASLKEKWFRRGDCEVGATDKRGVNGFTHMNGIIRLKPDRLKGVKSAMAKIGKGKSDSITFEEADAMVTFWHEITHNRNTGSPYVKRGYPTDVMEMMNEFVTRKTLPEFYGIMGVKEMPFKEFIKVRKSTGYNSRVVAFDHVIVRLGLDFDKVLNSAKHNLFNLGYDQQEQTAIQALEAGGIKDISLKTGKKIGSRQLKKLVTLCTSGYSPNTIDGYLTEIGMPL